MEWNFADAKTRFGKLFTKSMNEGPQTIRSHKDTVVVISERRYRELTSEQPSLKEMLRRGRSLECVDLERDRSPMRDVE